MLYYPNWHVVARHLFKLGLFATIIALATSFCHFDKIYPRKEDHGNHVYFECHHEDRPSLDFYLVGDIGGMEILDEHKKLIDHRPSEGQFMVAGRMKKLIGTPYLFGEEFFPEFVLSLGDNFYDSGISLKDADERFLKVILFVFTNNWGYRLVILTYSSRVVPRRGGGGYGENFQGASTTGGVRTGNFQKNLPNSPTFGDGVQPYAVGN
uniref:Uncharacterized protein n=1 Tax=Meloidogyne enterolobii TaxID=390850 RepID=A0A6V7TNW0_MELEN|nr:unnamed protein product [Meloidogyne enterolobii]